MGWREQSMVWFGPGFMSGITPIDWLRLLRDNSFAVNPRYLPRFGSITWQSMANSGGRFLDEWRFGAAIERAEVRPPIFILGHWRSGTTLLHDLFSLDERFAWPNLFQVMYPNSFLSTERFGAAMLRAMSPANRPQDNMRLDPAVAWEDEFVMCARGFHTPYLAWAFPRRAAEYDRYLTFRGVSDDEVRRWGDVLVWFLKKLSVKYPGKAVVLKSPTHTARVAILLRRFPGAKFVHIHRHPYAVFQSLRHTYDKVMPVCRLQRTDRVDWEERVFRQYREMHESFFAERGMIPEGDFCDVAFEDLERDAGGVVRSVYERLSLPAFEQVEPALRRYVESLAGYRKNTFRELPAEQRRRVAQEWGRCFDEWGYSREPMQ